MYVQIPANAFYFTLGFVTGIIITIWLLYMLVKRQERKNKENLEKMWKTLETGSENTEIKKKKK